MLSIKIRRLLHYFRRFIPMLSQVPKPGTEYNGDHFLHLLLSQREGFTTPAEDRYIEQERRRNWRARELQEVVDETYPPRVRLVFLGYSPVMRAAVWFAVLLVIGTCIFALSKKWSKETAPAPPPKAVYQITNTCLGEIGKLIEQNYHVKVIFDRETLADRPISGYLDTKKPLEEFLGDLQISHGIAYTFDEQKKELHFK